MRTILKVLFRLVLVVVPLVVMMIGGGMLWLSRSLAPLDGEMKIAGLSGPVTIVRDTEGVPHITAETLGDVAAGLGFVHAQERLWQMEVSRMAGKGRLSELFGAPTIGTDIWLRTMAIDKAAEQSLSVINAPTMAMLEGYARGVNAWMEREPRLFSSKLPPEFVILGHKPEPWAPLDTLISVKMMSVSLSENVGAEVLRLAFSRMGMDEAAINDLMPHVDADLPPPLPDLTALLGLETGPVKRASAPAVSMETAKPRRYAMIDRIMGTGASNNWVVSGMRTVSGKPVLANDPHLGLSAPSIWYLAHLRVTKEFAGPRNLAGASLPGTPFVFLGRNDRLAWGFTNTATDAQDVFVEKINPDNPDEYLTPSGWAKFGSAEEVIKVSGGEDVHFVRRWTRHGPVLPAGYKNLSTWLPENTVAALKWVALAGDDTTANAGSRLFDYASVKEFQDGMEPFLTPMQSMVVAGVDGNIGFISPGRVPIRGTANMVMGRAPVPGWDARYDWQGFVPYGELPRWNNPEIGAIGTANTKIVGPDYPHFLTFDWDEPYRQNRIDELVINAKEPHSPEVSRQVQADIYSQAMMDMKERFIKSLQGAELSTLQRGVVSRLAEWDGEMVKDRGEPLIFMAWLREMMIDTFRDDLGPAFDDWFKIRAKVMTQLLDGEVSVDWCDIRDTDQHETCRDLLVGSLERSLSDLRERHGEDVDAWKWGEAHRARNAHRPFSKVEILAPYFNVVIAHGGGPFTLDRGKSDVGDEKEPFVTTHGSSFRGIYDLADLDRSTFIQTTGQSGNVFSRHYRDFTERWERVEAITIPVTGPLEAEGTWKLSPAS